MNTLPPEVVELIARHVDRVLLFRLIQLLSLDPRWHNVYNYLRCRPYIITIDKDPLNCKALEQLDDIIPHLENITLIPYQGKRLNQGIINDLIRSFPLKNINIHYPAVNGNHCHSFDRVTLLKCNADSLASVTSQFPHLVHLTLNLTGTEPHYLIPPLPITLEKLNILNWSLCTVTPPPLVMSLHLEMGLFVIEPNDSGELRHLEELKLKYVKKLSWGVQKVPQLSRFGLIKHLELVLTPPGIPDPVESLFQNDIKPLPRPTKVKLTKHYNSLELEIDLSTDSASEVFKFPSDTWRSDVIDTIDCRAMGFPDDLQELVISKFNMHSLTQMPSELTRLVATDNYLQHIDPFPPKLTYLDALYNKLELVSLSPSLKFVDLSRNQFSKIMHIPALIKHLNLSKNKIESLEGISGGESLEYLDLQNNLLLVVNISLPNLSVLNLNSNKLVDVSLKCPRLSKVSLKKNNFTRLPDLPGEIMELDLSNNLITDWRGLASLHRLRLLDISENKLSSLPLEIERLVNIESLHANYNQLEEVHFEHNSSLKELQLDGNRLKSIDLTTLSLQVVSISNNQLHECDLPLLVVRVSLSRNNIRHLQSFRGYAQLEHLDISSNRLELVILHASLVKRLAVWGNFLKDIIVPKEAIPEVSFGSENIQNIRIGDSFDLLKVIFQNPKGLTENHWRSEVVFSDDRLHIPGGVAVGIIDIPPGLRELDIAISELLDFSRWTLPHHINKVKLTRKVNPQFPKVRFMSTELVKPPGGNHCFAYLDHLTYLKIVGLNVKMSRSQPMVCPMTLRYLNFDFNVSDEIWIKFNGKGSTSLFSLLIQLCFQDSASNQLLSRYTYDSIGHNENTQHSNLRIIEALTPPIIPELGAVSEQTLHACTEVEIEMAQGTMQPYPWPPEVISSVFDPAKCPPRLQGYINERKFGVNNVVYWEYPNPHCFDDVNPDFWPRTASIQYI